MPKVTSQIVPASPTDTYPTHDSKYGLGGHREVPDLTARDAISTQRRREGMTVFVQSEGKQYQLIGGITNSDWKIAVNTSGIAVLDFGAIPTQEGSVTITGQAGILETSNIQAFMVARSTPDNDENAHKFAAIAFRFVVSDIVAGVGFKINAYNMIGLVKGTFKIDWRWT